MAAGGGLNMGWFIFFVIMVLIGLGVDYFDEDEDKSNRYK